ncbi:hypothetical protein [Acaryochloris marina]|uniref:Uncharacterized protein n=1 Tax=Acaryochloris marina (strain MBIC 11017) TaxID=329726 RepID=A8ZQD9_ACAM1|nr:hypothetical protein [Acaryochloris marina]ABW33225.1 hypothetical protein AM1_G0045 [Acaryochloris marina MBIC11017]
MPGLQNILLEFYNYFGELPFIGVTLILVGLVSFRAIPRSTDLATSSAAGLVGLIWGNSQRTLVINSTTNLPELGIMLVSLFGLGRLGGIATPLGSNLSNVYLIFIVSPIVLICKWILIKNPNHIKNLMLLAKLEKQLILWHVFMSLLMFFFASFTYLILTGNVQFIQHSGANTELDIMSLVIAIIVSLCGVIVFLIFESKLKKRRPELFEDIDDTNFEASWSRFFLGVIMLCLSCYILNDLFAVWTELFQNHFVEFSLFPTIHYFIGSLISSLPEMSVAVGNYERLSSPDLNTALGSASQSCMTNLLIAGLGSVIALVLSMNGLLRRI